jgi:uncharacterized membrane protein HdeD (DUF308 family)
VLSAPERATSGALTVILLKWPLSGLWVFGLAVCIDLLLHGAWWVATGWMTREGGKPA